MTPSTVRSTLIVTDRTLTDAVGRGLISAEQAQGLRDLADMPAAVEPQDDERLRFISGFGDIFVTIGLALFLGALAYFSHQQFGVAAMAAIVAAVSWALAEFFTRSRRMALPSIVLLVVFSAFVFLAAMAALYALQGQELAPFRPSSFPFARDPLVFAAAALVTLAATAAHYWRFRVPITLAAGAAALAAAFIGVIFAAAPGMAEAAFSPLLLVCGVLIFALAMRFDLSDPLRLTRRTDIAFWLHMLAAPMIVHPLVNGFIIGGSGPSAGSAWSVLAIFACLGAVAVVIDRRAVLVSGLAYAGFAFSTLIRDTGFADNLVPLTMLVLGAFVLLLSAGWHGLRRALLRLLPQAFARRLPNPNHDLVKVELQP